MRNRKSLGSMPPPAIRKKMVPPCTGPAWAAELVSGNLPPPIPVAWSIPWDWVHPGHGRDISRGSFYLSAGARRRSLCDSFSPKRKQEDLVDNQLQTSGGVQVVLNS